MENIMTLIASTLFIAALLLSVCTMLMTLAQARPRIEQVIAERNTVGAQLRVIRLGEVRRAGAVCPQAVIVPFAPRVSRHSNVRGYIGATETLKLAA
jgi:fructose-1,6-bisphosphatase/sedoheptulose 1,7-bisphosphatase-like protein